MNLSIIEARINTAIRFFLYVLIFWVPYSSAMIETCVIISLLLWMIKRTLVMSTTFSNKGFVANIKHVFVSFKPKRSFLNFPIAIFLLICLISAVRSDYRGEAIAGFFTKTLEWFIIYFLVLEVFTEKKHIYTALGVFVFTAVATCLDSFFQYYISGKDIFNGREMVGLERSGATAGFRHPNSLGAFLTIYIPFILSIFLLKTKKVWRKVLYFILFVIGTWSLVITFSRGAWFGVFMGAFFSLFLFSRKIFVRSVVALLALILCFSVLSGGPEKLFHKISGYRQGTAVWRLDIWGEGIEMIKQKPLLGHGLNTFMKVFQKHRKKYIGLHEFDPTYAHNCYIQMVAEVGVLGFLPFLSLLFLVFWNSTRLVFRKRLNGESLWIILIGLAGGTFAFLVHSFFDVDLYSLQLSSCFWYMLGMLMCVYRLLNNSSSASMSNA